MTVSLAPESPHARAPRHALPVFVVYALLTFAATHWPRLELPSVIQRPDIIAHMCVFGLWTLLAIACAWFGPWYSRRNLLLSTLIAAAYSGLDEWLQNIPFIHRQAVWDDFAANLAGVVVAGLFAALLAARRRRRAAQLAAAPQSE